MANVSSKKTSTKKLSKKNMLLLGTRKGLLQLEKGRSGWALVRQSFLGIPVQFSFYDARTETLWASLEHGHWGPKLHKSSDMGKTWAEVACPAYPGGSEIRPDKPAKLELVWYIAPGGSAHPNRLWFGTIPGGLFQSDDNGASFTLNQTLWNHPSRKPFWFGGGRNESGLSSLFVDPRDPKRIFVGASCGGVFLSEDGGKTWLSRNKGLRAEFLPDPYAEFGHDPHFMTFCEANPDVLWQQNHCGIFRSVDGGQHWKEISQKKGPAKFGWAIAADPRDEKTAWVVPAVKDEMRLAVDQSLCVCRTEDGGKSWKALRKGLPQDAAYDIVFRHALDLKGDQLAFGSSTGNAYYSANRGDKWETLGNNFAPIYSVRFV